MNKRVLSCGSTSQPERWIGRNCLRHGKIADSAGNGKTRWFDESLHDAVSISEQSIDRGFTHGQVAYAEKLAFGSVGDHRVM